MTEARFEVTVGPDLVVGVLHLPDTSPAPCVVACHGLGASKDSDKYLLLGRELPRSGLALARFDFRGSGESDALPGGATVASRVADLVAVIERLAKHPALDGRAGLLGSSLGGFVALWAAAERADGAPVVTWNAPASLAELGAGHSPVASDPLAALAAEVRAGRYAEAPRGVSGVLVVQGEADTVVAAHHARALWDGAAAPKQLHLIAGADHRLSEPAHRAEAVEVSRRWFARHLVGAARGRTG